MGTAGDTANASTQGILGATSSGSINITVIKPAVVNITGLNDMTAMWNITNGGITWTNDVCVYSSRANAGYSIMAVGSSHAAGGFVLADGTNTLPYNVAWNSGGVGNLSNSGVALNPNVPSVLLGNAATDNATCAGNAGGPTARLIVSVPESAMKAASPGNYTESLTLLVSPN